MCSNRQASCSSVITPWHQAVEIYILRYQESRKTNLPMSLILELGSPKKWNIRGQYHQDFFQLGQNFGLFLFTLLFMLGVTCYPVCMCLNERCVAGSIYLMPLLLVHAIDKLSQRHILECCDLLLYRRSDRLYPSGKAKKCFGNSTAALTMLLQQMPFLVYG